MLAPYSLNDSSMIELIKEWDDDCLDDVILFWLEDQNNHRIDQILPFLIWEKQKRLELWED